MKRRQTVLERTKAAIARGETIEWAKRRTAGDSMAETLERGICPFCGVGPAVIEAETASTTIYGCNAGHVFEVGPEGSWPIRVLIKCRF